MLHLSLGYFGALRRGDASIVLLLVKATIILLGALGVTVAMHRAAAGARHMVWLVTLGALLLVPVLTVWGPLRLRVLPAASVVLDAHRSAPGITVARTTPNVAAPLLGVDVATPAQQSVVAPSQTASASAATWLRNSNPLVILFAIWATIALAILMSLAYAALALRRVVRASRPLTDQRWLNTTWEVSDRLGLDKTPRLLRSRETSMPFACGLLHPTIVLPAESDDWSLARRRAVLLHELAHVRRRDLIGHTLGRVACALYWFHPLVWTAAKRLRSESERACDDLVLSCGTHAADYAEHLLDIVTSVRRERTPLVALAMARRKEFEGRMLAILDPQLQRAAPSRRDAGALVMSLGVLAVVVGAASPVPRAASVAVQKSVAVIPVNASAESATRARATVATGVSRIAKSLVSGVLPGLTTTTVGADTVFSRVQISPSALRTALVTSAGAFGEASKTQTPDERAELLAKILRTDTSASIRRTAAWGLQQYANDVPDASSALVSALRHDVNADVREMSAWALADGKDGDPAVVGALSNALRIDASESVRAISAWSLAQVGNVAETPVLTAALADRSAEVRARAAWALGNVQPKAAPPALVSGLKDADPNVRAMTAWALHNIADVSSIPALQAALRSEADTNLQIDYIRALAAMGDESVDALRTLLTSSDARVRSIAVTALAGGGATGPWPWPWPMPRPFP